MPELTQQQKVELTRLTLSSVDLRQVEQTYSGKPGCMCGCRGTHYNGWNQRVVENMIKALDSEDVECEIERDYIYVGTEQRVYCLYLSK